MDAFSGSSPGAITSALSSMTPFGQRLQGFVTLELSPSQLPKEASAGQHVKAANLYDSHKIPPALIVDEVDSSSPQVVSSISLATVSSPEQ